MTYYLTPYNIFVGLNKPSLQDFKCSAGILHSTSTSYHLVYCYKYNSYQKHNMSMVGTCRLCMHQVYIGGGKLVSS